MANPTRLEIIIAALDRATGPLRALSARLRAFRQAAGIDQLGKALSGVGKGFGRVFAEAGKLAGLATAAAVGIGVLVNKSTDAGDALGNAAARAKLTIKAYTGLQFAAAKAGIEQEKFADAVDAFNKNVGEAKLGKGKLASFLEGVSPRLLRDLKSAKGNEAALNVIARAFDRVRDSGKRAALAGKVFGNTKFAQFFAGGSKAIAEAREEFNKLDDGASERFVEGAQAMDNELDSLTGTISVLGRGIMAELFPAFVKLARSFNAFLLQNKDAIKTWAKEFGQRLLKFADELPARLQMLGQKFNELKAKLEPVAKMFGGFGNLLAVVAGLIVGGPLLAAIGGLAVAFVGLGIAIATTPIGWFLAGIAAIGAAAAFLVKDWEPIKEFFSDLWGGITEAFKGFLSFFAGVFTGDLKRAWEGLKSIFTGGFKVLKAAVTAPAKIADALLGGTIEQRIAEEQTEKRTQMSRSFRRGIGGAQPLQRPTIGAVSPTGPALTSRPVIGAESVRKSIKETITETRQKQTAAVKIDLANVPRGTKVTMPRNNTADVELRVGYTPELAR